MRSNSISQLSHPNIVRWFGMYKDFNATEYMVMEYVSGGNLKDLLESKKDALSFSELMDMIISAATGMEYLESKRVIHRDLAARNLLVKMGSDNRYEVKVSDFGLARQSEYYRGTTTVTLPIRWSSPVCIVFCRFLLIVFRSFWLEEELVAEAIRILLES